MCMSYINKPELVPKDNTGLENYKFVTPYHGVVYVYHKTTFNSPLCGNETAGWLCCTEGWSLREDNKWHETVSCGWKPDRVVDTIEDIFNYYRKKEIVNE